MSLCSDPAPVRHTKFIHQVFSEHLPDTGHSRRQATGVKALDTWPSSTLPGRVHSENTLAPAGPAPTPAALCRAAAAWAPLEHPPQATSGHSPFPCTVPSGLCLPEHSILPISRESPTSLAQRPAPRRCCRSSCSYAGDDKNSSTQGQGACARLHPPSEGGLWLLQTLRGLSKSKAHNRNKPKNL